MILTDNRRVEANHLSPARGLSADQLLEHREKLGISYVTVSEYTSTHSPRVIELLR